METSPAGEGKDLGADEGIRVNLRLFSILHMGSRHWERREQPSNRPAFFHALTRNSKYLSPGRTGQQSPRVERSVTLGIQRPEDQALERRDNAARSHHALR
jgi:hypothetical protein